MLAYEMQDSLERKSATTVLAKLKYWCIDLAKPNGRAPKGNNLSLRKKRICFSWIRNSK